MVKRTTPIHVDLVDGKLLVRVPEYHYADVKLIKQIKHRRHNAALDGWRLPAQLSKARELRELFGRRLVLSPIMRAWAAAEVRQERRLLKLQEAGSANLRHTPPLIDQAIEGLPLDIPGLPPKHPFRRRRDARPYQRADIAFMALDSCINANDVGTGKTLETIGAIFESQIYPQPILIVAPRRSLESVWKTELERFTDYQVFTSEQADVRRGGANWVGMTLTEDKAIADPIALGLIADDLRLVRDRRAEDKSVKKEQRKLDDPLYACHDYRGNVYRFRSIEQRWLFEVLWGAVVIDEFQDTGINNRRALFYVGLKLLKYNRLWLNSATPIGGKPRRLWPILNMLYPKIYTSEWAWIEQHLQVEEEEVYIRGGRKQKVKHVGGIRDEKKFYEEHRKHMIRRNKLKALPGLPLEVELLVETPMLPSQLDDYVAFDRAHEIVLGNKRLSGSIVLSQYTRLRQMANTKLTWDRFNRKPITTPISGKLEPLKERLAENGICEIDYEPGARAYIGVLDKSFADTVSDFLDRIGVYNARLTGDTKDSAPILRAFERGGERPFVIVMTVATGGSALNLERANSAHLLDEPWDPDQQYQFFGRGNRGSRTTSLKCYTYRTPNSIQEYVAEVAGNKKLTNKNVLDFVPQIEKLRRK